MLFQISAGQRDKVLGYIKTAKKEGATIHCGGTGWDEAKDGYYVLPTIITDCDPSMQCVREEIFGPVVCVMRFSTEEEAIRLGEWSLTVFYLDRRYALTLPISYHSGSQRHRVRPRRRRLLE